MPNDLDHIPRLDEFLLRWCECVERCLLTEHPSPSLVCSKFSFACDMEIGDNTNRHECMLVLTKVGEEHGVQKRHCPNKSSVTAIHISQTRSFVLGMIAKVATLFAARAHVLNVDSFGSSSSARKGPFRMDGEGGEADGPLRFSRAEGESFAGVLLELSQRMCAVLLYAANAARCCIGRKRRAFWGRMCCMTGRRSQGNDAHRRPYILLYYILQSRYTPPQKIELRPRNVIQIRPLCILQNRPTLHLSLPKYLLLPHLIPALYGMVEHRSTRCPFVVFLPCTFRECASVRPEDD